MRFIVGILVYIDNIESTCETSFWGAHNCYYPQVFICSFFLLLFFLCSLTHTVRLLSTQCMFIMNTISKWASKIIDFSEYFPYQVFQINSTFTWMKVSYVISVLLECRLIILLSIISNKPLFHHLFGDATNEICNLKRGENKTKQQKKERYIYTLALVNDPFDCCTVAISRLF